MIIRTLAVAGCSALTACGGGSATLAAQTAVNTAVAPTPAPAPAPAEPTPGSLALNCTPFVLATASNYSVENNTWGSGGLSGWQQCAGAAAKSNGNLVARWTWNWNYVGDNVKAYPEVIFGNKPGYATTSGSLPRQLGNIGGITVNYDIASSHTGVGNLSFDLWLTNTGSPTTFGVPPITHEIMIWLDSFGGWVPGGNFIENAVIDGVSYRVSMADGFGWGWRFIALMRNSLPAPNSGSIELGPILAYIRAKNWAQASDYLASVEFGNEVVSGSGETNVYDFSVAVR